MKPPRPPQFTQLCTALLAADEAENAPPANLPEGLDQMRDHFDMLEINAAEGDPPEVVLENLAALIVAAQRTAHALLPKITEAELQAIIEAQTPER